MQTRSHAIYRSPVTDDNLQGVNWVQVVRCCISTDKLMVSYEQGSPNLQLCGWALDFSVKHSKIGSDYKVEARSKTNK
ncbi:hypothetical protein BDR05DRAFT_962592 [Suillus weaverae]|nr:hypothetical protein BDR05DRAFT_962592 [Suillus weaverae]